MIVAGEARAAVLLAARATAAMMVRLRAPMRIRALQLQLFFGRTALLGKQLGRSLAIVLASAGALGAQPSTDAEKLMDEAIAMERAGQLESAAATTAKAP